MSTTEFTDPKQLPHCAPRPLTAAWAKAGSVYVWKDGDRWLIGKVYRPRKLPNGGETIGRWVTFPDIGAKEITDLERAAIKEAMGEVALDQCARTGAQQELFTV
jgi:hypothetical protein